MRAGPRPAREEPTAAELTYSGSSRFFVTSGHRKVNLQSPAAPTRSTMPHSGPWTDGRTALPNILMPSLAFSLLKYVT